MAIYVWPLSLPQSPQKGFTESIGVNIIRTPTDQGPAKTRKRSLRASPLSVNFLMTTAQTEVLETFCLNTLQATARFDFTHPRTFQTVEVRIVPSQDGELYKLTYTAPGYWTVNINLEILP
jgi:hypothetical protein